VSKYATTDVTAITATLIAVIQACVSSITPPYDAPMSSSGVSVADDRDERPPRPRWVLPGAVICLIPLAILGVAVGGWAGLILILIFASICIAIALEER